MSLIINQVRKIAKKEYSRTEKAIQSFPAWLFHILIVVNYANILALILKADQELVEIAALLHDLGRVKYGQKDHEITGALEAEKILQQLSYPPDKIKIVKEAIKSHRGSKNIPPKSLVAKIIANADAMAHYDAFIAIVHVALVENNNNGRKTLQWLEEKIDRNWQKKLTIPEAKEMMREKYQAIKLIINSMKKYIN